MKATAPIRFTGRYKARAFERGQGHSLPVCVTVYAACAEHAWRDLYRCDLIATEMWAQIDDAGRIRWRMVHPSLVSRWLAQAVQARKGAAHA